ncbi:MAG TPA: NAD-dependent epimerase/dehydratase family protein, partial [Cyclobacteriaceae bacterium]|nr:NAD-dependent epimerase/dehydratase family protein [Cyclobacteriaceae bacterium]
MSTILITGGAGFIGSSLAEKLLINESYSVVVVDNFLTGNKTKVPTHPRCTFIRCDVNNLSEIKKVMLDYKFDFVFHYA